MPLHSQALEFSFVSESSPTITTSHKQWGLLIRGLRRRVAAAGRRSRFSWQEALLIVLKVCKQGLHWGLWRISGQNAPSLEDHKRMLQFFLKLSFLLKDQTLKGDAGQCQETTNVQGEGKWSFRVPCCYTIHGPKSLGPIEKDYPQNDHGPLPCPLTCHLKEPNGY